jgi:7,8-dihydro-6-hydroxymethylpterin dimethyltransferase
MDRKYIYHESTTSICPKCLERVPAKIILKDNKVFLKKYCKVHGKQEELFEENIEYHLNKRNFDKPGTISKTQTTIKKGCPFDCGLCLDHDQHTCIGLIEVTNRCNLGCPTCYANSGKGESLSLNKISEMLNFFIESEGGEAEILQISGGEPTTHPEIIKIIELARSKKIRYVMLNTNGIRIAEDEDFVKELSKFKGKFEVYLQFDGFDSKVYSYLRGKDLSKLKLKAIENLTKYKIPITLVTTIEKGINDKQIGKILEFGIKTKGVRGVNLQPIAYFGRLKNTNTRNRITLSGIIKRIEEQVPDLFQKGDIIPLPCNVERVAVTYMAKSEKGKFIPITRNVKIKSYLPLIDNTFAFDADRILKNKAKKVLTGVGCCSCMSFLKDIKSIIPLSFALKSKEEKLKYINENTFRISVTSFIDVYNFDLKSMQKECVHIITPDLKKIPFSSYNMFYRK